MSPTKRSTGLAILLLAVIAAVLLVLLYRPGQGPERARHVSSAPEGAAEVVEDAAPVDEPGRRRVAEKPDAENGEPAESHGTFRVRVLGPGDVPVAGVHVAALQNQNRHDFTDDDGYAALHAAERELTLAIMSRHFAERPTARLDDELVVRVPDFLPLTVCAVDPETDTAIASQFWVQVSIPGIEQEPHLVDGHPVARIDAVPARGGDSFELRLNCDPIDSVHAMVDGNLGTTRVTVSRYAERLAATIPFRHTFAASATVFEHDGARAEGATVQARVDGYPGDYWYDKGWVPANGTLRFPELPFLYGEDLVIVASVDDRSARTDPLTLRDRHREPTFELQLPAPVERPDSTIGMGGSSSSSFSGRPGIRRGGNARVDVTVRRRDGSPAPNAKVQLRGPGGTSGRTDESGLVTFEPLIAGEYTITLVEPGLIPIEEQFEVDAHGHATVELMEPIPGRSDLLVLHGDGTPVEYARVSVKLPYGLGYSPVVDGVQRVIHFTDSQGRCRLEELPGSDVSVKIEFGSRKVERPVTPGEAVTISIDGK